MTLIGEIVGKGCRQRSIQVVVRIFEHNHIDEVPSAFCAISESSSLYSDYHISSMLHYLLRILTVWSLFYPSYAVRYSSYKAGIPVPGRTVPETRIFDLYAASCSPASQRTSFWDSIRRILQEFNTKEIAMKAYSALYMGVGDVDVDKMMGKWFLVVDSPRFHSERCVVVYYELLEKTEYTAVFTVRQYSRNDIDIKNLEGYGRKLGPDPGEFLVNTGHPSDPCPYSVVQTGPENEQKLYDYVILSQPLKYPTVVLARNPQIFEKNYKAQVKEFLERYNFWKPLTSLTDELYFINSSNCRWINPYFNSVPDKK